MTSKGEAGQLLAKVLHHIIALKLAMHQHIDPQFFLPGDNLSNRPFDKLLILLGCDLSLLEASAHLAHLGGLREGTNRRGWQRWQIQSLGLYLLSLGVGR